MRREEIVDLMARWHSVWNTHDVDAWANLYAETCVVESPLAGGAISGRSAVREVTAAAYKAFPDFRITVDETLIDGDRVAQFGTLTGTDTGGFMGIPATNKPFQLPIVTLFTLDGGQIVRERRIYDFTGMLVQIGVLKAKPM